MKKNRLLVTTAIMMMCFSAVSCAPASGNSSTVSSNSSSVASSSASSVASSSESSAASSSESSVASSSSETVYENPIAYAPNVWDYDSVWGQKKILGGTMTYEDYYDKFPDMCDGIATFNYAAINMPMDPADAMRNELFDNENEAEAAQFFADLAKKIVPDWNSEESKTSAEKQEKNALAIYDYVTTHVYYDDEAVEAGAVTKGYTLTGMMNNSDLNHDNPFDCRIYTVCRGYCNLISVMMNGIGLPCIEDKGREYNTQKGTISDYSDHVWNEIYYGGRWHVIDATWESNVAGGGGYWYKISNEGTNKDPYVIKGVYDNTQRMFYDIIPDYSNWEDSRNYTNYYVQSHIIEQRNGVVTLPNLVDSNGFVAKFNVYDAHNCVAEIGGYKGTSDTISLPSEFNFSFAYNGSTKELNFPVWAIGTAAFKGNTTVKNVTVNVSSSAKLDKCKADTKNFGYKYCIMDQAFAESALETIVIGDGVDYVEGPTAFAECENLKSIKFLGATPVETHGKFRETPKSIKVYYPNNEAWTAALTDVDGVKQYAGRQAVPYEVSGD